MLPWRKSRVIGKEPKNPLHDFLGSQMGSDSETSLEVSWVPENPGRQFWEGQSLRIPQQFFPHGILVFFFRYVVQVAHMTIKPLSQWSDDENETPI